MRWLDTAFTFGGVGFERFGDVVRWGDVALNACETLLRSGCFRNGRKSGVKPPHSKASRRSCDAFHYLAYSLGLP